MPVGGPRSASRRRWRDRRVGVHARTDSAIAISTSESSDAEPIRRPTPENARTGAVPSPRTSESMCCWVRLRMGVNSRATAAVATAITIPSSPGRIAPPTETITE